MLWTSLSKILPSGRTIRLHHEAISSSNSSSVGRSSRSLFSPSVLTDPCSNLCSKRASLLVGLTRRSHSSRDSPFRALSGVMLQRSMAGKSFSRSASPSSRPFTDRFSRKGSEYLTQTFRGESPQLWRVPQRYSTRLIGTTSET